MQHKFSKSICNNELRSPRRDSTIAIDGLGLGMVIEIMNGKKRKGERGTGKNETRNKGGWTVRGKEGMCLERGAVHL